MKTAKLISVYLLTLVFFVSTSGLPLIKHYCTTEKTTDFLFSIENIGNKHKIEKTCCEKKRNEQEKNTCEHSKDKISCCIENFFLLKVSDVYSISSLKLNLEKKIISAHIFPDFEKLLNNQSPKNTVLILYPPELFRKSKISLSLLRVLRV